MDSPLDASLAGRYAIADTLGEGATAIVFRAHERKHDREVVLATVQVVLLAGQRLSSADHVAIARLLSLGERRTPGVMVRALPTPALLSLARAAVESRTAVDLFSGYAEWDGAEPDGLDDADHGESQLGELNTVDPVALRQWLSSGASLTMPRDNKRSH